MSRRSLLLALVVVASMLPALVVGTDRPAAAAIDAVDQGTVCVGGRLTDLNRLFDTEPAGIVGADYQRATELPDGRVFWTFQDGAIRTAPDHIEIVHNIAAVQDGPCFTFLYRGTRWAPRPYLFADATEPYRRWFWPMGAAISGDGNLYVFTAELRERSVDGYLVDTEPVATRVAIVDPSTAAILWEGSPPDASANLYGWSVTSDADHTYLYAQCSRQFGYDEIVGVPSHDRSCTARITVGRVPRDQVLTPPEYWDGTRWQPDPARAATIVSTADRIVNAHQILWSGGRFVAVNKQDDWWGDTIEVSTSPSPTGPFVALAQVVPPEKCDDCNTFFASWVPYAAGTRPPRTLAFGWSNNRWDGQITSLYRPSFGTVPAPIFLPAGGVFRVAVPLGAGVPALNVTAVRPADAGFLTVFPCDRPVPTASNLNHEAAATTANLALVRPDARGEVCIFSYAATDLVVDLAGTMGSGFAPEPTPRRLLDTRPGDRVAAETIVRIPVPVADAVAVNLTAVRPAGKGFLTAFPCGGDVPTASNVNYVAGENVANLAAVRPGDDGEICVFTSEEIDLVVDLAGSFDDMFEPEPVPSRLVDTRTTARVEAGGVLPIEVPAALGAVLNVTAVRPTDDGFLTAFPCGGNVPTASNVNYAAERNVANLAIVRPGDDGRVCVFTSAATDLVVDLAGALDGPFAPEPTPVRLADTRLLP